MKSAFRWFRPWHGLLLLAVLGVGLAVWLLDRGPVDDREQIRELIQESALRFNSGDWAWLAEQAWPESERDAIREILDSRSGLGVRVRTPVDLSAPEIYGEKANVTANVEWTMAMGRIRDNAKVEIELEKHQGRWFVLATSMRGWRR